MNVGLQKRLIGRIERCLDSVLNVFRKKDLLSYCDWDSETLIASVKQWEAEGKLEILRPLEIAKDDDEVIRMKSYIEGKCRWGQSSLLTRNPRWTTGMSP